MTVRRRGRWGDGHRPAWYAVVANAEREGVRRAAATASHDLGASEGVDTHPLVTEKPGNITACH